MSALRRRLRKTFAYPSSDASDASDIDDDNDSSSGSGVAGALDEEHQERLIARLAAEDARRNALYLHFFVALPVLAALYFAYALVVGSGGSSSGGGSGSGAGAAARNRGIALIACSSTLCTAYILRFQPVTGGKEEQRRRFGGTSAKGPLETFLVPLNAVLVVVMQVAAVLSWRRGAGDEAWRASLPAIVFGISMFARHQLAPLDLEELKRARYELKGA